MLRRRASARAAHKSAALYSRSVGVPDARRRAAVHRCGRQVPRGRAGAPGACRRAAALRHCRRMLRWRASARGAHKPAALYSRSVGVPDASRRAAIHRQRCQEPRGRAGAPCACRRAAVRRRPPCMPRGRVGAPGACRGAPERRHDCRMLHGLVGAPGARGGARRGRRRDLRRGRLLGWRGRCAHRKLQASARTAADGLLAIRLRQGPASKCRRMAVYRRQVVGAAGTDPQA